MNAAIANVLETTDILTRGYIVLEANELQSMLDAVKRANTPVRHAPRHNHEASRHISFLLRQKAVEMAYASTGR